MEKKIVSGTSTTPIVSSVRNLPILDNECIKAIADTVTHTLLKNAGSWISSEDIQDVIQSAYARVWLKRDLYDPGKSASFKTWACTVAHNHAIQIAKKLKKTVNMTMSTSKFLDLDGTLGDDDEPKSLAMDEPGEAFGGFAADDALARAEAEAASEKRLEALEGFFDTLNDNDRLFLRMMIDGRSKQEMMDITHKSGGSIDTCICRLRSKALKWMKESDYYGIE